MKKNVLVIALALICSFGCEKNELERPLVKKDGNYQDEGQIQDYEGCPYLTQQAARPVLDRHLDEKGQYSDPDEWQYDRYLILIAQGIHDYASNLCVEERWGFWADLDENIEEMLLQEVIGQYPVLESHLYQYFSTHGEDFTLARQIVYQNFTYVPSLHFENIAEADMGLPAYIGAGVQFEIDDITDYIPFRLECDLPGQDVYIGKVETDFNGYDPIPNTDCIENLLVIVNWSLDPSVSNAFQSEQSTDLGDVEDFKGAPFDSIFPSPPAPAPAGCEVETQETYRFAQFNMLNHRYDRNKRSEYYISYATQNGMGTGSYLGSHECDKLKKIHKNDLMKWHYNPHYVLRGFNQTPSAPFNAFQLADYDKPTGGAGSMGFYLGATYERDWYASHKRGFFAPYVDNGVVYLMALDYKAKYAHEYCQIIFIEESDWCDQDIRIYGPKGFAVIEAKW